VSNPYTDAHTGVSEFSRTFSASTSDAELVWHRDRRNRKVTVVAGAGWKFQHDNQIPTSIVPGDVFVVEQNQFHRLLKGETDLVLQITEY
jgi:quercetin dioxygenase-like cupin family protein